MLKNLVFQYFDQNPRFLIEVLGILVEILGLLFEILGISNICNNYVSYNPPR